jgi:hypothetical protein
MTRFIPPICPLEVATVEISHEVQDSLPGDVTRSGCRSREDLILCEVAVFILEETGGIMSAGAS